MAMVPINYDSLIEKLAEAPDRSLAKPLAKRCREFIEGDSPFEDPVVFLADLRDRAVYTGGASQFVLLIFQASIEDQGHDWEDVKAKLDDHPDSHRNQHDLAGE